MYRDSEITRRTALRNIGIAVGGIVGIAAVNKLPLSRVGAVVEEGAAKGSSGDGESGYLAWANHV